MTADTATFPSRATALRRAGRHALASVVEQAVRRVPAGGVILVATSGGADSTALAVLSAAVASRGPWTVVLATVDHGLRPDSGQDAEFVQSLGEWLGVPVLRERVQVKAGSQLAASARRERYAALKAMAGQAGAAAVLMAHHAEDQFETMLMRLARGSGARAAGGMPAARALMRGVRLLRPLLERSRGEVRELLRTLDLHWREDPGNASTERTRGRLRHRVLAEIQDMAPGAAVRASRAARRVRAAARELGRAGRSLLGGQGPWPRERLRTAPREVLAEALRLLDRGAGEDQVERGVRAIRARDTRPRVCRLGAGELRITVQDVRIASGR
jgi:tRNA(Ile)-lysidine synthetase-like protein